MRALLVLAVVAASARLAHAQNKGFLDKDVPVLEIDSCSPDADASPDELRKRGAEHYQRGEVLYLQGDYKGAVTELIASYCEIPYYSILKDIGQAFERELEYAKAIAYLERYVLAVPDDAKKANACAPDPQDDKQNVLARISVLSSLHAKVRVQTVPADAQVSLLQNGVVKARGSSGGELDVIGGPYQLVVERAGFRTVAMEIHAEIGKPYTFLEQLNPLEGRLKIRVVPDTARLFLDKKQVGTGVYAASLASGKYTVEADADGKVTETREIDVLPDRDTELVFEMKDTPKSGRRQLLAYSGIAGAAAGALLAAESSNTYITIGGAAVGLAGGFLGAYFGTPHDIPLGTSSLTITSSLIGGVAGGSLAAAIGNDLLGKRDLTSPLIAGGLVLGAATGYLVGEVTHPSPGDAAVINSGALWGSVAGGLFAISFQPGSRVSGALVLSGLAMGTVGGTLLQRYFTVSRKHALIIDASGVVGSILGLAAETLVQRARDNDTQSDTRTADYALGGLAAGLVIGGILTRNVDLPKLPPIPITPAIGRTTTAGGATTTTFGIQGAW